MRLILLLLLLPFTLYAQVDCTYNQLDSNGMRHGPWIHSETKQWSLHSEINRIHRIIYANYFHGKREYNWMYWENGFLVTKEHYDHHRNIFKQSIYHSNNKVKEEGHYKIEYGNLDTSNYIDPSTGREYTIIEYPQTKIKTGIWNYYDESGKLIQTKQH